MNQLLNYPDESLIREVLADRDEALRMNAMSLKDIVDAKQDLSNADYALLTEQLTRQREMAKASKLQMEAYFRYRIEKLNGKDKGTENRQKLEACLKQMEKMGEEIEKIYGNDFPFLKASLFNQYVQQIREAVAEM